MSFLKTFLLALSLSFGALLVYLYAQRPIPTNPPPAYIDAQPAILTGLPDIKAIQPDIFISAQITPESMSSLPRGIKSVIDLRPDDEAPDQPPASSLKAAAQANGLAFSYIPVLHGDISDDTVHALEDALARSPKPVLLFCRSGRRAVNAFTLAEASRADGPDAATLAQQAERVALPLGQLLPKVHARIAQRPTQKR